MRQRFLCVVLLLGSLAVAQGQPFGYLASTTTITPGTWEEELELGLTMPPLRATLSARFTPAGFAAGAVVLEFTERWTFLGSLALGTTGFLGCRLGAQAPLREELVLLGRAEWGLAGFSGGEVGVLFNPGSLGFQAVSVGGIVKFDRLGLTGQEISFFADLGVFSVETASSFSTVGFERLTMRAEVGTEGLSADGCVTLIQGEGVSAEVGGHAVFGNMTLRLRGLFKGQGLREAQGELSWAFAERNTFTGSVVVTPAGIVQSVVRLSLVGDWGRFSGALWFTTAGLYEANAALTMTITEWATVSASVVMREAVIAEAALGVGIGLRGVQVSARSVWDTTGFRELQLRIEVPFGPERPD